MNYVATTILWTVILFLFCVLASIIQRGSHFKYICLILLFYFLSVITICIQIPIPLKLNYNWIGKIQSTIVCIIYMVLFQKEIPLEEFKIAIRQKNDSIGKSIKIFLCLILFAILLMILSYLVPNNHSKLDKNAIIEMFVFQATLPGIHEEIMYRGVLLTLLNRAFKRRFNVFSIQFGIGLLIQSIMFGILHGIFVNSNLSLSVDLMHAFSATIVGIVLGLIAENSESLLIPIMGHNIYNMFIELINVVR
jgi:uncharacterized protein